jgi:hypothetical protein
MSPKSRSSTPVAQSAAELVAGPHAIRSWAARPQLNAIPPPAQRSRLRLLARDLDRLARVTITVDDRLRTPSSIAATCARSGSRMIRSFGPSAELTDMVIRPGKFICTECVDLCVEILEERCDAD